MPANPTPRATLDRLIELRSSYGPGLAAERLALLKRLDRARLATARQVLALHEALCFLRAYPDDEPVLAQVEAMLAGFDRRADLRRQRRALHGTGIAGTTIRSRFFAPVAFRLARTHGGRLTIDWRKFRHQDRIETFLPLLVHEAEVPALDEYVLSPRQWIESLKGPGETDAAFLVRSFEALPVSAAARERLYDELDPPLLLAPGPATPARGREKHPPRRVHFQAGPLDRSRPALPEELARPPLAVQQVSPSEGQALIDLARDAMVTRNRDLDVFAYGDPADVRLVECGEGLQFAMIGAIPERRLLLEGLYGFLTLKNGVAAGYVLVSALMRSAEVAYNVFESFRGGDAARIYGRVLSMTRALFGVEAFTVAPYQLGGDGNEEGILSGAYWFYEKLGFEPRHPGTRALLARERARLAARPGSRSSPATLRRLARHPVSWGPQREAVSVADLGLAVTRLLAGRFGSARIEARVVCAREAASALGLAPGWPAGLTVGERLAWDRWAPLVLLLPGLSGWSAAEKRACAEVIRAKGGARESEYVRLFDAHPRLGPALASLVG